MVSRNSSVVPNLATGIAAQAQKLIFSARCTPFLPNASCIGAKNHVQLEHIDVALPCTVLLDPLR
ncbi:hypothetical protein CCR75_002841 [Bremia lactucae]|uniref:Uncharacterized protein n=1 Tax=Bremia lactucae TaxID=4779 RepID=A0A976IDG6_BRELC|nr:hypothetical protein CCR75_002841 [Bremia lactucae]